MHLDDPGRFAERWAKAIEAAEPWRSRAAKLETAERRQAWERCGSVASQPRILDLLVQDASRAGLTGEERTVKTIYLSAVSAPLDRLASLVVKGQSSSGKSWTVQAALRFLPTEAYYEMTAASERALVYDKEPLAHRTLVVYEASGLESETLSYIVRSLLSEGRLRYPTVVKPRPRPRAGQIHRARIGGRRAGRRGVNRVNRRVLRSGRFLPRAPSEGHALPQG